jgi:hypothetical protein
VVPQTKHAKRLLRDRISPIRKPRKVGDGTKRLRELGNVNDD